MAIYRTEELTHEDFIHDIKDTTVMDASESDNPDYSVWHFKAFDSYEPMRCSIGIKWLFGVSALYFLYCLLKYFKK